MTNESSSMTMKSDNESNLVNSTSTSSNSNTTTVNNNNIYLNCNKSTATVTVTSIPPSSSSSSSSIGDLPSITLAPFSKIKRETDSSEPTSSNRQSSSSSMVTKSTNNSSSSCGPQAGTTGIAINSVSAKMGSRRIFTPQFKLQVLESYRNDSDCKGNQRATARKYNIHRRQIQKWLQCESNLRSSVANISANNVKHQFHNITHQMPIVTTSTAASSSSIHTNNNHHTHHNQQYKAINNRLSLDTTRHSVALTSIPIQTAKAAHHQHQGVLAAAAAAVNIGDVVGAVAPLSSPSPSSTSFLSNTTKNLNAPTSPILHHPQVLSKSSTMSPSTPLQCSKPRGPVIGGPSSMIHTQYHHDGISIHTTPPALLTGVPESVTIITHHPHTPHMHVSNLKNHFHHYHMEQQHHHHLHHHHLYSQVAQPQLQLPPPPPPLPTSSSSAATSALSQQSSERRPFVPSASLPALPISSSPSASSSSSSSSSLSSSSSSSSSSSTSSSLSTSVSASAIVSSTASMTAAVALTCTDTLATTPAVALSLAQTTDENRSDELRDYPNPNSNPTTTTVLAENRYMNENEYALHRNELHRAFGGLHYYMPVHVHPAAAIIAPIDLSLGPKRIDYTLSMRENNNDHPRRESGGNETVFVGALKREPVTSNENENTPQHDSLKTYNEIDVDADVDNEDDDDDSQLNVVDSDFTESTVVDLTLRKRKVLMPTTSEPDTVSAEKHTKFSSSDEHEEKDNEKPTEPAKPFKLFKPYLLGEEDTVDNKMDKQRDPIIWSHHTACLSPPISHDSHQCSSRGSHFQTPPADAYPFPAGSPSFQSANASAATTTSLRCPKGSPVSGYESSSSIHSDSASSTSGGGDNHYNNLSHTTYSFDLKVHTINADLPGKHLISPASAIPYTATSNVQRWLDQESGIRQSIALYG